MAKAIYSPRVRGPMIIFIIPVYNESKNILTVLHKTSEKMKTMELPYTLIVVNDGSTDNTLELLSSVKHTFPLIMCGYFPNQGVGAAFRIGFAKALEICKEEDIIITKEADNTSDLNILDQLIFKIQEGNDVVLASCYAKEGAVHGTNFFRKMLSIGANFLLKLLVPLPGVHTYSSFYRAYRAKTLLKMNHLYKGRLIEEKGFECMVELLIKLGRDKIHKIIEVPMILDGSKREDKSKMKVLKTVKGFLKVMIKENRFLRGS